MTERGTGDPMIETCSGPLFCTNPTPRIVTRLASWRTLVITGLLAAAKAPPLNASATARIVEWTCECVKRCCPFVVFIGVPRVVEWLTACARLMEPEGAGYAKAGGREKGDPLPGPPPRGRERRPYLPVAVMLHVLPVFTSA